jgi:hypothetical protein
MRARWGGIVNLTADTLIPEISLDVLMPKIKGFPNLSGIFSLS